MSLREVMVTDPVGIGPDATVAEAAATMARSRIGSLMVDDVGDGVGIITERDVVRAAGAGGDLLSTRVRDWMTVDPTTASVEEDVESAAATMLAGGFRHLPVTEGDSVVGVVSMRTLLNAKLGGAAQQAAGPEGDDRDRDPAPNASPDTVQQRRSRMFAATRLLQERSGDAVEDPDQWRAALTDALDELAAVVTTHVTETEGRDGFLEELVRESEGRLSPAVRRLEREHQRIVSQVDALRTGLETGSDEGTLREGADELVAQLEAHRHRGSDLLWRAYAAEIGVGD